MSEDKTMAEIAKDGIDQTEIIMLKFFIGLLKKYPTHVILAQLEEDLAKKQK